MSRGARTRVAQGIYRDAFGLAAIVGVGAARREQRFPLDTPLDEIREWRRTMRGMLLLDRPSRGQITRRRDPFDRAVSRYLALIQGRESFAADRSHLAAWVERFGDRPRASITAEDIRHAFAEWRVGGQRRVGQKTVRPLQPATLRHRYRVLQRLWRVLDGKTAPCPLDEVERPVVRRRTPQDVPLATITAVAAALEQRDPITHARFLVLSTTGQAPAEVMRATAADLDLRARTWRVIPAKGRSPHVLLLTREMVRAWRTFARVNAWGPYDTTRYAQILRRCGWPRGVRPYHVRHALAMDLLRRGADISDVQAWLGHTSVQTTRTHYAGLLEERAKQTRDRLEGRLERSTRRQPPNPHPATDECHASATNEKERGRKR